MCSIRTRTGFIPLWALAIPLASVVYVVGARSTIACGATGPAADPTSRLAWLICNRSSGQPMHGEYASANIAVAALILFAPTMVFVVAALITRRMGRGTAWAALAAVVAIVLVAAWIYTGKERDMGPAATAKALEAQEPAGTRVMCARASGGYWEYHCRVERPNASSFTTSVVVSDHDIVARTYG